MKKLFFFVLSLMYLQQVSSQVYTWTTTDSAYHSGWGVITQFTLDHNGNLIVLYGPKNANYEATYLNVVKYDQSHNVLWIKHITSPGLGSINLDIGTDNYNNIYITGYFGGNLIVDHITRASVNNGNMFLIKFDQYGSFQWIKNTTGGQAWGISLNCDQQNNIYVSGRISGTACFDTTCLSAIPMSFVVKYDSIGDLVWVKGISEGSRPKIKTDRSGNIYVTSYYNNNLTFDGTMLTTYGTNGLQDIYLSKIDPFGNWLWAAHAGGIDQDEPYNLDLDSSGNVYITGFFGSSTANFGGHTITNYSNDDYFLAKYDSSGTNLWAVRGWKNGYSNSFCVDKAGNAYFPSSSQFINKFDANGNFVWANLPSNVGNGAMTADDSGNVYIAGVFLDSTDLGNYHLVASHPGEWQAFVAKLELPSSPTLINETTQPENWSIYPNPSGGEITLSGRSNVPTEYFLRVSNALGKTVHSEKIKQTGIFQKQLDLSAHPPGMYFLEILPASNKGRQCCKKLIIQ